MNRILNFDSSVKKATVLSLLMLLTTVCTFAQYTTVSIGSGSSVTGTTTASPINRYWTSYHCQMVYTKAELNALGFNGPGYMIGFGFNISSIGSPATLSDLWNYTIQMKLTTATSAGSYDGTGLQQVYFNADYYPVSGGYDTVTLQAPFYWDGTSNILVDVCNDNRINGGANYNASGTVVYTTVTNGMLYGYSDNVMQCGTATGNSTTSRPNAQMVFFTGTCSGSPTPGTLTTSSATPCPNVASSFFVSGATIGIGITYQWQTSTNNTTWSNISSATGASYSALITSTQYIRRAITCAGNTTYTNSVYVAPSAFYNCYCNAAAVNIYDSDIGKVKVLLGCNTMLNNGIDSPALYNSSTMNTYTNYRNLPATKMVRGLTHNVELYYVSGGAYYNAVFNVFIDYNQNGIFDAAERLVTVANQPAGANGKAGVSLGTFTIPATALTGITGMRIHLDEGGSATTDPCSSPYYGEIEDYLVDIKNAPDVGATALVSPVNNQCGSNPTKVIVRLKNFSATDTSYYTTVRTNITGSITATLNGGFCRLLPPGAQDTAEMPITLNTIGGGTYTFTSFPNLLADPNRSNDTLKNTIVINPLPATPTVIKGTKFTGTFSAGSTLFPDYVATSDTITYELTPPIGFTNATFGTSWNVAVTAKTLVGTNFTNLTVIPPSGGANAMVRFVPVATEVDSTFEFRTKFFFMPSGCDTTVSRMLYVAPRPVVSFTNSIACFGSEVKFTDGSTIVKGDLTYLWDFGDVTSGDSAIDKNASYLYSAPGTYTVTLKVTSGLGYTTTLTKQVNVGFTPVVNFTYMNVCEGTAFNLVNTTTIGGTFPTMTYNWSFPDNTGSTSTNTTKLFSAVGNYNITLTATSQLNCKASSTKTLNVFPMPHPDFTVGNNLCTQKTVSFTNASTVQSGIIGNDWRFGNGEKSLVTDPATTYTNPGSYTVKLVTTTPFGCTDSVSKTISVTETPSVSFTALNPCSGDSVLMTNNSSLSGSGTMVSNWNFGDGNSANNNNTTLKHKFPADGNYIVSLTVANGSCSSTITNSVTVKKSPVADFNVLNACVGHQTSFMNSSSGAGNLTYNWDFGNSNSSTQQSPTNTYSALGNFNVKLDVNSDNGCGSTITKPVTVNALPDATFTRTYNTAPIGGVRYRQVQLSPANTSYFSYNWDMGDGTNYTQLSPVHNYLTDGNYNITLKVTDNNGCDNTTNTDAKFNLDFAQGAVQGVNSFGVYPNPFKGSAIVSYELAKDASVTVKVFDMLGREVAQLDAGNKTKGAHKVEFNTANITGSSNVYIVKLEVNGRVSTRQLVEVR